MSTLPFYDPFILHSVVRNLTQETLRMGCQPIAGDNRTHNHSHTTACIFGQWKEKDLLDWMLDNCKLLTAYYSINSIDCRLHHQISLCKSVWFVAMLFLMLSCPSIIYGRDLLLSKTYWRYDLVICGAFLLFFCICRLPDFPIIGHIMYVKSFGLTEIPHRGQLWCIGQLSRAQHLLSGQLYKIYTPTIVQHISM